MALAIAIMTVVLDIICIVHIFRNDKPYWWGFLILSFPVMGCVVYYFMEVFPDSKEARKAGKLAQSLGKRVSANDAFQKHVQEVEICGSIDNKLALARECTARGMHDDAVTLYRSTMHGVFADDPNLLLALAAALVDKQDYSEARVTLAQLQARDAKFKPNEVALLRARVLEGQGAAQDALREYESLLPVYAGLEPRYRHALLLQQVGRDNEAQAALAAMQTHAQKHRVNHDGELAWLDRAKKALRG